MLEKGATRTKSVDASKITIGEVLSRYADDVGPEHKDPDRTAYAIEALTPYWGNLKSADISVSRTREYEKMRQRSPWTIRRELGVLRAALNHAELVLGMANPPKIKLPKKPAPRSRWLTKEEISAIQSHSPPHLHRFILISILTGRRKASILGLGWESAADHGWIDVEHGMIHFKGFAETESAKKRGSIAMPKTLWDAAKQWKQDGNSSVVHHNGKGISDIDTSFDRACRMAGLIEIVPHMLKHTAVTWAFQNGMTLEDAVEYFATSAETLMEVYRQHSPLHQSRATAVMNDIGIGFIAGNVAEERIPEVRNS